MIRAGGGFVSITYCEAIAMPLTELALLLITRLMVAWNATVPARLTSSVASLWSLLMVSTCVASGGPGSMPSGGMITVGSRIGRLVRFWNCSMSGRLTFERPMIAMVWPLPFQPAP